MITERTFTLREWIAYIRNRTPAEQNAVAARRAAHKRERQNRRAGQQQRRKAE